MTYRERREKRAARLREWADKREQKSAAAFKTAQTIADGIPFGQPILVGHHSEKHHRRDLDRIDRGMRAGIEHEQTAASMNARADEIERQAERAIYSDDHDAIACLRERIAELETRRERMKAINRAIRKGDGWETRIVPPLTDDERAELGSLARVWGAVYKPGYPPYALQNLGGNITRQRARLAMLEVRKTDTADGDRASCAGCREAFNRAESDATDPDAYCSAACERGELS